MMDLPISPSTTSVDDNNTTTTTTTTASVTPTPTISSSAAAAAVGAPGAPGASIVQTTPTTSNGHNNNSNTPVVDNEIINNYVINNGSQEEQHTSTTSLSTSTSATAPTLSSSSTTTPQVEFSPTSSDQTTTTTTTSTGSTAAATAAQNSLSTIKERDENGGGGGGGATTTTSNGSTNGHNNNGKTMTKSRGISSYTSTSSSSSSSTNSLGHSSSGTGGEVDDSLTCKICLDIIKEPFISRCGHSFCYQLNQFVERMSQSHLVTSTSPAKQFQSTLSDNITINDINSMVAALLEKKKLIELKDQQVELDILLDFLQKTKAQKMEAYKQLKKQISFLDHDIQSIESQQQDTKLQESNNNNNSNSNTSIVNNVQLKDSSKDNLKDSANNVSTKKDKQQTTMDTKKRKIDTHLDDLQTCYFTAYEKNQPKKIGRGLMSFSRNLSKFTRFTDFRVVTTLKYGDLYNTSSIVSSIEFDKDDEFFATAGVTKKIKVFEYAQLSLRDHVDVHVPVKEMTCHSKISCLSWNTYIKSQIASSDYEGIITLWDVNTGQNIMSMEEHEKRVWSVDFSRTDPTQLASGSDDTRVKLWSTTARRSIATIESKANICCVKFNPSSSHLIAFGSADHHIHYYDLRHTKDPLFIFKGHRKAVSYVKFMNRDEIISASTDSTLKLWNVSQSDCVRTYVGHANEKNFVGLTVSGDYICCGSENNGVYTYYKTLSKPIVTHRFGATSGSGEETDDDGSQFVSSVCWKKNSNILLAANSQGNIKVLELI
ncbi:hypothetical protein SAMD00019534_022640 [Acytostelium subglobosum LB1]|uniref:hypothetical protein n=1 Tax=Acytostelium subglobosum LB1 TaxID=1410327 RepID=UPI0006449493|nr:hypothetical protein SAMD00019534_022640 [Acytostelium subglobosum LB1]GAM19089.1 hypothetical protein SAMD00019534_022640 [Acytostelium subglobosum LB1]|eukprot:XP_012757016.1 hypothetical protein SAMD00019534_022640 [Acytostelium subglobosum LB1]